MRQLDTPFAVGSVAQESGGPWRWNGAVTVEGARQLRLKLTNVSATEATLWVYSAETEPVAFDTSVAHNGVLWTPTIEGEAITLEVESSKPLGFTLEAVAEMAPPRAEAITCATDVRCSTAPGLDLYSKAIAHYRYISGGAAYICTGGLVNDRASTYTPYFLTANHCISNAAEAASIETFWDYRTTSCGGSAPPLASLGRGVGGTLVATSAASDVSLLKLAGVPSGRAYLGWRFDEFPDGTQLFRISHPEGLPQGYSTHVVEIFGATCNGAPRGSYLYTRNGQGATAGGSSGAPLMFGEGQVVGQLVGRCPQGENPCDDSRRVDGAFRSSWSVVKPFLDPEVSSCSTCVPSTSTACILGGRFTVQMSWKDFSANLSGNGSIIRFTENKPEIHPQFGPLSEAVFFSMYAFSPNSLEAIVRMIKGANINNKYWVFLTGFAGAEYTVEVTDTQTCKVWKRTVPSGATNVTKDFEAFPFP